MFDGHLFYGGFRDNGDSLMRAVDCANYACNEEHALTVRNFPGTVTAARRAQRDAYASRHR